MVMFLFLQMDILSTGQIIRYIATQGPMQNTCIDFWQVSNNIHSLLSLWLCYYGNRWYGNRAVVWLLC